jgi:hypothetical protein
VNKLWWNLVHEKGDTNVYKYKYLYKYAYPIPHTESSRAGLLQTGRTELARVESAFMKCSGWFSNPAPCNDYRAQSNRSSVNFFTNGLPYLNFMFALQKT